MIKNSKKLLRLPKRTNSTRSKIALDIPDLDVYLISRLLRLKIKYENINKDFRRRLNKRKYSWQVDEDFLILRYMCHRGAFRNDINEKCVLCKTEGNGIEHVTNN